MIDFFLIFCACIAAVFSALGETKNANGNLNTNGWVLIIIAFLAAFASLYKTIQDEKEKGEREKMILSLQEKLNEASSKIDTTIVQASAIDEKASNQVVTLFSHSFKLDNSDERVIPFRIIQGMKIRVTRQNCDNGLFLNYNNNHLQLVDEKGVDPLINFREEPSEIGVSFENQGDSPCGVDFEILGTWKQYQIALSKAQPAIDDGEGVISREYTPRDEVRKKESEPEFVAETTTVTEQFYVSVGNYKSAGTEQDERVITEFGLNRSVQFYKVPKGKYVRYLIGNGNDTFEESLAIAQKIRRGIKNRSNTCFVVSIVTNGDEVSWKDFDQDRHY